MPPQVTVPFSPARTPSLLVRHQLLIHHFGESPTWRSCSISRPELRFYRHAVGICTHVCACVGTFLSHLFPSGRLSPRRRNKAPGPTPRSSKAVMGAGPGFCADTPLAAHGTRFTRMGGAGDWRRALTQARRAPRGKRHLTSPSARRRSGIRDPEVSVSNMHSSDDITRTAAAVS